MSELPTLEQLLAAGEVESALLLKGDFSSAERRLIGQVYDAVTDMYRPKVAALEAALAVSERNQQTLRDALETIATVHDDGPLGTHEGDIARAALASLSGPQPADTAHRREAHG